jgi:hypothetical protein
MCLRILPVVWDSRVVLGRRTVCLTDRYESRLEEFRAGERVARGADDR